MRAFDGDAVQSDVLQVGECWTAAAAFRPPRRPAAARAASARWRPRGRSAARLDIADLADQPVLHAFLGGVEELGQHLAAGAMAWRGWRTRPAGSGWARARRPTAAAGGRGRGRGWRSRSARCRRWSRPSSASVSGVSLGASSALRVISKADALEGDQLNTGSSFARRRAQAPAAVGGERAPAALRHQGWARCAPWPGRAWRSRARPRPAPRRCRACARRSPPGRSPAPRARRCRRSALRPGGQVSNVAQAVEAVGLAGEAGWTFGWATTKSVSETRRKKPCGPTRRRSAVWT